MNTTYYLYEVTGTVKTKYGRRRNKVVACLVIAETAYVAEKMAGVLFDLQGDVIRVNDPEMIKEAFKL